MSVQFGRWNTDGLPVDREYLTKAGEMLGPYGPDGGDAYIKDNVGILYRAFHTTKESRQDAQPHITPSGAVICWDGRLDNREELVWELRGKVAPSATDLAIVAAAYEAWGTKCFAKFTGDWAISVWDPKSRSLILAKDLIGTRHLYYSADQKQITWSTILDPLILLANKKFALEEEYIAGWLSFFPATHLTPYVGIHSVPPSCFVRLASGRQTVSKYWDFDPSKRIHYRTDSEYEEHFRHVFGEAVRRRLRSDSPVLAELSGGMDSSSIVCMADTIIARGAAETPRLDTVSYHDDSEPNWNEKPYFMKVEAKRGRAGCHIDVSTGETFQFEFDSDEFVATPGSVGKPSAVAKQFATCCSSQGNRLLLSGTGGDEVTGGVPTPIPELMDLIARAKFKRLQRQLKFWALNKRKPWFYLLFETLRGIFPSALVGEPKPIPVPQWFSRAFVSRNRAALKGYRPRLKLFGSLPSFQDSQNTLEALRRQLGCSSERCDPPIEKCHPYLDRDLLEFLFAVPVEQLLRPGQRRSLMRRSLVGIVPDELLNRRRKAYLTRSPMAATATSGAKLIEKYHQLKGASLGIFDAEAFFNALQKARQGETFPIVPLMRSISVESWLWSMQHRMALIGWLGARNSNGRKSRLGIPSRLGMKS
ncbi:MAG: asparagine synthase-related protein [Candidatus Acidiferrum sp.]